MRAVPPATIELARERFAAVTVSVASYSVILGISQSFPAAIDIQGGTDRGYHPMTFRELSSK
jgi:hypothetical protein